MASRFQFQSHNVRQFSFFYMVKDNETDLLDRENSFLSSPLPNGVVELREAVANHLMEFRGMEVDAENIIIGAGTEYLYSIIVQLLGRDSVIAVEDPGYRKIGKVYESNGVECLHLPIDNSGIQTKAC
mgnify:CR=1 FL=1